MVAALLCVALAGCQTPWVPVGAVVKQTAEGAYQAVYAGYLDGDVTAEELAEARGLYDRYFAAQKAYHDVLVVGLEPSEELAVRVARAAESLVGLAEAVGVLEGEG